MGKLFTVIRIWKNNMIGWNVNKLMENDIGFEYLNRWMDILYEKEWKLNRGTINDVDYGWKLNMKD